MKANQNVIAQCVSAITFAPLTEEEQRDQDNRELAQWQIAERAKLAPRPQLIVLPHVELFRDRD